MNRRISILASLLAFGTTPVVLSIQAQNAAPADRTVVNTAAHSGNMLADSPITFPKEGDLPATPWPGVKAGLRTEGDKSFWSGIEPFGSSWRWDFYTYWCEMRGSPPRGQTWGNSFIRDPKLKVEKGRWICVEQMIRMNAWAARTASRRCGSTSATNSIRIPQPAKQQIVRPNSCQVILLPSTSITGSPFSPPSSTPHRRT